MTDKEFNYYLQIPGDGKYYNLNNLAYYFEDMGKKEILIKELGKRIVEYDEKQNVQLGDIEEKVAAELTKWDDKVEELPGTVNELLTKWVDDGTLTHVIDTTLIDQKVAPLTALMADIAISVKSFGAKGDGVTDDTASIQNALNSGRKVIVPKGTYMINAITSLKMTSNQTLLFEDGAEFIAITNSAPSYAVILIDKKDKVSIINATIKGERFSHTGSTGEWGACIRVISSTNVTIEDSVFSESWGDGLYIGASDQETQDECDGITIKNIICSDNRRLGMAITAARNVTVYDSVFEKTGGFSPEAGVDIEPNIGFYCENIKFFNCKMRYNNTSGFIASTVSKGIVQNIDLFECNMSDNKFDGAELIGSLNTRFTNCTFNKNRNGVNAYVSSNGTRVVNSTIQNNTVMGVRSYSGDDTIIEGCLIQNNADNGVFFKGLRCKANRNIVSKNLKTGILVDAGGDFADIVNNDVMENTQSGIYVSANNARIVRNNLVGNSANGVSSSIELYSKNSIVKYNEVKLGTGLAVNGIRMTSGVNNVVSYNDFTGSGITNNISSLTQTNSKIYSNFDVLRTGTTAQRPTDIESGFEFYDTTLGKPIYWNGSTWRDTKGVSPENRGINTAVGTGVTTVAVSLPNVESNAFYSVAVSPQWNTSTWITNKSTTGFIVNFGNPPSTASAIDWSIRR